MEEGTGGPADYTGNKTHSITHAVMAKGSFLLQRCSSVGPAYLLYVLFLQALTQQEPCVEFLSWALRYIRQLVHLDLTHREKQSVRDRSRRKGYFVHSSVCCVVSRCP